MPENAELSESPAHPAGEAHGSWWPLVTTVAAVLVLLGILEPWLALPGFLLLAVSIYAWVREEVRETASTPPRPGRSDYWYATVVFIVSEVLVFGALFTYWFWGRAYSDEWSPPGEAEFHLTPVVINTLLLVASGVTAHFAEERLKRGHLRQFRRLLTATLVLGGIFLLGQVYEYATLGFAPNASAYTAGFYALTGTHGVHVLGGLVVLAFVLHLAYEGVVTPERTSGVQGAIVYWHFVDVVWLVLLAVVYLGW